MDSLPRRNAVEWRLAGAKPVQSDPHELQSVGVHDVEAAAPVHEHHGESGVADDRVDNEWVQTRIRDVVGTDLATETVEVFSEHVTLFEGVIDPTLVIRARLLEHIVE